MFKNVFYVLLPITCLSACLSSYTREEVIANRQKYMSPSLKTFEAYQDPFVITKGSGYRIYDHNDKPYIDLMSQNLCVSVGHAHPRVVDAAIQQLKKLPHCTTMYYHEESAMLAKELVETMPPHPSEDWVVHFVNTGNEAVELALLMASIHYHETQGTKGVFYSLENAYHGLFGDSLLATKMGSVTHESQFGQALPSMKPTLESFEEAWAKGEYFGGIIMEPIQGYGGVLPLPPGFMKYVSETIREQGGITIVDEIQTGFGRTGTHFWGFEDHDMIPDIMVAAKGIANGIPMGVVICRRSIAETFAKKMFFTTFGANPVASASARVVLQVIKEEKLMENSFLMGKLFNKGLNELCIKYPQLFTDVRGQGLLQGLEVTGSSAVEKKQNAIEFQTRCLAHGVVMGRGSPGGNVIRIQPPLCIDEEGVSETLAAMDKAANECINK